MKKILQIILILLLIASAAYSQVRQQWVQTAATSGSGFKDIHLDAAGNVYVLGCSADSSNTSWIQLASYSPSGEQRFCIYNSTNMIISGWFFDSPGNIYIGGYYTGYSGTGSACVFKYNSSGILQWEVLDTAYNKGILKGFTGDASGNSYLLKNEKGKNTILKFTAGGTYIQSINIDEMFNSGAITVDQQNNIIISGLTHKDQTGKCIIMKFNSHGFRQWLSVYDPEPGSMFTGKMALKLSGSEIYIMLSASGRDNNSDYLLLKYYADGTMHWASQFNKDNNDIASDFVIDSRSNVIVTGNNGTVKYNKKGMVSWSDTTRNMVSAAVDKQNNIYLTGIHLFTVGSTYADMVSLKFSTGGYKMWTYYYKEIDPNSFEAGQAITVDTAFNVYSCGYKATSFFPYVYGAVVKYSQQYIDTSNLRFMPLAIGDVWVYKVTGNNIINHVKSVIAKDTIAEGKRYFYFPDFPIPGYSNWLRTDSITGNLYAYMPQYSCSYSSHERIVDSLSSGKMDTLRDCISTTEYKTCVDTGSASIGTKITSFKQFQNNSQIFTRCYAKDIGIFSINSGGSVPITYSLSGCVINGKVYGDTLMRYSITGTVRYKDNKQPVTSGKVKALKYNYTLNKIITVDSGVISSTGIFRLGNVPLDSTDIMAYQDDEMNDYAPGFHDSTIYWQGSSTLIAGPNMSNIDVYVERLINETGEFHFSGHVYALNSGSSSPPLENTRIYLKSGSEFKNFDITDSLGGYLINSLPSGVYTFIVDRLGFYPTEKQIELSEGSNDSADFYLLKYSGIEKDISTLPVKYTLIQNYPNPFNPSTTFLFEIPAVSDVRIIIYDITGREIYRLMDGQLNAGKYKINWDASDIASGVYFYRFEAGNLRNGTNYIETKKLILMK